MTEPPEKQLDWSLVVIWALIIAFCAAIWLAAAIIALRF